MANINILALLQLFTREYVVLVRLFILLSCCERFFYFKSYFTRPCMVVFYVLFHHGSNFIGGSAKSNLR
jgi:hypothetical protein